MTDQTLKLEDVIAKLLDILQAEDNALLAADYSILSELAREKTDALGSLENAMQSGHFATDNSFHLNAMLRRLNKSVSRNARLLKAAMNGAVSAHQRLENIRSANHAVGAYQLNGQNVLISAVGKKRTKIV